MAYLITACHGLLSTHGNRGASLMPLLSRLRFVLLLARLLRLTLSLILPLGLVILSLLTFPVHDVKGRAPGSSWLAATNGSTGGAYPCRRTFIHPLAGVWGGFFSPRPCLSGEDWGVGQRPTVLNPRLVIRGSHFQLCSTWNF